MLASEDEDPEAVHEELLHTLGNLTVTAYNGQLSNSLIDRKQAILSDSHLELNKTITPEGKWRRSDILARAGELADRAVSIWPAPMPGVRDEPVGRDWSTLHAALAALPDGAWTTYSDVAELIGSHQVPVGTHLASTPVLNAHRVLTVDGRVAEAFRWLDPSDTRDVRELLRAEGVRVDADGQADMTQRLRAEDLAGLIDDMANETLAPEEPREHGWRMKRVLRFLRHFYDAPEGKLFRDEARRCAVKEGYDPRGVAGFYQGTASLRKEGKYRILTDAGRQFFEENRQRLLE